MRKLFSIICLVLITCGMLMQAADAKRFGGGRSFGYQRSASSYNKPHATPFSEPRPSTPFSGASRWLGPLAGLAAGGLLASLFMGKGIGTGILSWLLLIGGGLLIIGFIRSRLRSSSQFTPPFQNTFGSNSNNNNNNNNDNIAQFTPIQQTAAPINQVPPAQFDATVMLRDAKVQFIRLQAAYDSKNLEDIREFTTPEIYAEIQLQFQERGNEFNQTEVVSLDAQLLDTTTELQQTIASVLFTGLIKENPNEPASQLNETWHFKKLNNSEKWLVAGIQQDSN